MSRDPLARRAADARKLVLEAVEAARRGGEIDLQSLERAAELLYDPPEGDHELVIEPVGWAVEHPDKCRELGDPDRDCLIGVDIRSWLELEIEPPLEPGRYLVKYDGEQGKTRVVRRLSRDPDTVSPR